MNFRYLVEIFFEDKILQVLPKRVFFKQRVKRMELDSTSACCPLNVWKKKKEEKDRVTG